MAEAPSTNKTQRLSGKIAIVTGGASGIGEATARVFANEGARVVVIADIQNEMGIQVAKSIGNQRCIYIHCDVTDEDQVQNLIQSTVNSYGQVRKKFQSYLLLSLNYKVLINFTLEQF
jgi:NAD(P)-dependent dehydrogenase (short-subunit alcohol dehydrogenase family)